MPTVSAPDLALQRSEHHRSDIRLSYLVPPILWSARLNDATVVKGETSIDFNAGTGSFFSMIEALQEVWVGTALQSDNVGRLRVKAISSGDGGVTGTVTVAGHSHQLQDNNYLTFYHNYPLKPRRSYIDPATEIWYMDDDIVYSNQNTQPPPVVIAGDHRAGFLVSGSFAINVDASNSDPKAASITSYALTVASTAGTPTVNFNTGTGLGDITFTAAGYYWAKYTVTNSNGKSQVSYRLYMVHDPDRTAGSYPFIDCDQITIENDWEGGGWTAGIKAMDYATLADIPDHTLVVIWGESYYNGTESQITFLPDNSTTVFTGYVRGDADAQDWATSVGEVDIVMSTVEGVLRQLHSFSTSLIAAQSPVKWYEGKTAQKPSDIVHNLLRWRTTLYEVCDVLWEADDTLLRMFQGFDEGNPYDMVNVFLYDESIRARVQCDQGGRIHIVDDQQLMIDSDRSGLTTIFAISSLPGIADFGGPMAIPRKPEFEVPFVTANGFYWDGAFVDGKPDADEFCSIAPGGKPLWRGPSPQDKPKQTVSSQDHLNQIAGRHEAKINNPIEEFRIELHGNYLGVFDCAYSEQFTMDLQASQNPRGITWSDKPLYLRHVMATYNSMNTFWDMNCSFEPEHVTTDGVYTECPSFPPLGGNLPLLPPPEEVPGALLTGASVNYKSALGDLWTKRLTQGVTDLVQDPFWRVKQATDSPASAIVFRCGIGFIKRSTDAFASVDVDVTPSSDPPNNAGDSPAPTVASVTFIQGEGSYINQDEFVFLATWQNSGGTWRSWLAYTDDNGSTWSWKNIGIEGLEKVTSFGSTTSVYNGSADVQNLSGYSNSGMHKTLCVLTETKAVQIWADNGPTYRIQGTVIDISGDTLTPGGTDYVLNPGDETSGNTPYEMSAVAIGPTKFLLAWIYYNGSIWPGIKLAIGTISATVISMSSVDSFAVTNDADCVRISMFDEDASLVVYGSGSITGGARVVVTTGANPTHGSELPLGTFGRSVDVATLSTTHAVVISEDNGSGNSYGNAIGIGRFGNNLYKSSGLTFGNAASKIVHEIGVRKLDSTRFVISWYEDVSTYEYGYCRVGTVGGPYTIPTIDLSTPAAWDTFSFDVYEQNLAIINPEFFIVGYKPQTGTYPDVRHVLGKVNASTNAITYGTVVDNTGDASGYGFSIEVLSGTKGLLVRWNSSSDLDGWTINWDIGDYAARGLGLSIGKSAGDKVWVTGNLNAVLYAQEFALPSLALSNTFSMGVAAFAATEAKTRLAYPFVPFGYDDVVYVFGRMYDPQSLGIETHIIRTLNGGAAWALIENTWGVDHCGALIITTLGYMYAIRNRAAQAKLYRDNADNALTLRLTLPFDAPVAPHGMTINFYNGDAYICSWFADPIMVVQVNTPFVIYSDLTFNHDNTDGIEAIIRM